MNRSPLHHFHIPVMGLAYTIDTPVKVAHFGISSVISIVEDKLVEMMRQYYYHKMKRRFVPILPSETDYRARRITDYLDVVNEMVQQNFERLKKAAFEKGSEIVKYFELLPEDSMIKKLYLQMVAATEDADRSAMQDYLRTQIKPGAIDVNIMTKLDRNNCDAAGNVIEDGSDAVSALRGFAQCSLQDASVVFSAGMNPRLFNYLESCEAFAADESGRFRKKIIIKVSDYRSALIQGKYLAKKGIWVSEFRVESGLNCGGHAFATEGILFGPILQAFKNNRQELIDTLFAIYNDAFEKKTGKRFKYAPAMSFTAQGGIGTAAEDAFLKAEYQLDSTGWGTPFLLVPEATTVDDETLSLLCAAGENDVVLSNNSPLGVRFNYLQGTSSHREKLAAMQTKNPGTACTEKHLAFNTEFTTEPICTASRKYQKLKLAAIAQQGLPPEVHRRQVDEVLAKECLCVGLSNAAAACHDLEMVKGRKAINICPGPNIANFSQVASLQQMTDHIYGRSNLMTNPGRPHIFVKEIYMYIDFLKEQLVNDSRDGLLQKRSKYYLGYCENMRSGIAYCAGFASVMPAGYAEALEAASLELDALNFQYAINTCVTA